MRSWATTSGKPGRPSHVLYTFWVGNLRLRQTARVEAITSRPLPLAAVGRTVHSGGQTTLYLTPLHGKANMLKPLIANIHAALQHAKAAAEQFKTADRWALLLRYISNRILPTLGPFRHSNVMPATG